MNTKERYINLFTDYGFKNRDLKNSLDTAFDEGRAEGREEQKIEIAGEMLAEGESTDKVARFTGLALAVVEELKSKRRQ
ncbi:MAG: hypothetical protein WBM35_02690 [Candidatus Electrothrix sp.]